MKEVLEIRVNIKAMRVGSVHKLKIKKKRYLSLVRNTFVTCYFLKAIENKVRFPYNPIYINYACSNFIPFLTNSFKGQFHDEAHAH